VGTRLREFALHHRTPGVPGPLMNLGERGRPRPSGERVLSTLRIHLDVDVRRGRREVPERQGAKAMEQIRDQQVLLTIQ
jgi:hypothetical protein